MKPVKRSALTLFLAVLSFVAAAHPHSFIRLQTQGTGVRNMEKVGGGSDG